MAKKKKGAETAPETMSSVSQNSESVNEKLVAELLRPFDPADWLDDAQALIYSAACDGMREIEAERTAACVDLDAWTPEYNERWNGIRNLEYSRNAERRAVYTAAAVVAFVNRHTAHVLELETAYRRACAAIVADMRERLVGRLVTYGMTLQDGQRIDDENNARQLTYYDPVIWAIMADPAQDTDMTVPYARTPAEYDVLTLFSDSALTGAMQARADHLFAALDAAYMEQGTSSDALIALTQTVWTEVLTQKWTISVDTDRNTPALEPTHITTFKPQSYATILHKTMAAHSVGVLTHKPVINADGVGINVGGGTTSRLCAICSDDLMQMFTGGHLTPYQAVVADAVLTLILDAMARGLPYHMTTQMIFAAMPGTNTKPNAAQRKEIADIMYALRHLDVYYTGAQEFQRRGVAPPAQYDTFFAYRIMSGDGELPGGIDQCGNIVPYYDFDGRVPILLDVAIKTKQLFQAPAQYVQVPGNLDNDKRCIVRYLAQRVAHINNDSERGTLYAGLERIKMQTLLQDTGHADDKGSKATRTREFYKRVLEHFKGTGWLDDFAPLDKDGRVIEPGEKRTIDCYEITPKGGKGKKVVTKKS